MFTFKRPSRLLADGGRRRIALSALVCFSLVAAACGSSSKAAPSTTAPSTTAPAAPATTVGSTTAATQAPATTAGSGTTPSSAADTAVPASSAPVATDAPTTSAAGPASGDPVTIGFVNMENGPLAQPAIGDSARGAVSYINKYLGGVGGHPIAFDQCLTDGSPEASTKCGNQFVADKVPLVFIGLDFGDPALLPILQKANIPVLGQEPITPADYQTGQWFAGSQVAYALGAGVFVRDTLKSKKVVILNYNTASAQSNRDTFMIPALKAAGATVATVDIDPAQPDFSVFVAAALADNPDLLYGFLQETDCTKMITISRQLGYKGNIMAGNCGTFVQTDAAASEGVYALGDLYSPDDLSKANTKAKADIALYLAAMKEFAPTQSLSVFTQFVFAGMMNLWGVMNEVGPTGLTGAAVQAKMAASSDQPSFMADTYSCAAKVAPDYPALCGASVLVFQAKAGKLVQASDWIFGPDIYKPS
ncbi:MAG TPA: ABC transporter substrate-binding protein [Ilumatobacteraceae bacterium]